VEELMLNPRQPLWLPAGSIRAVLALFVVIVGLAFLIARGGEQSVAAVVGFMGLALGYYLGKQTSAAKGDE
jgi:hypothetical protein